jgi:hypothetical protein
MRDNGCEHGEAEDEGHPQQAESEGGEGAPDEGLLEVVVVEDVGDGGVGEVGVEEVRVLGQADSLGPEECGGAVAHAYSLLNYSSLTL